MQCGDSHAFQPHRAPRTARSVLGIFCDNRVLNFADENGAVSVLIHSAMEAGMLELRRGVTILDSGSYTAQCHQAVSDS